LYQDIDKKGRPYAYPAGTMPRCFVVRIWLRIPSNNCLQRYSVSLSCNDKVRRACGLDRLPDRRTFDRRFKILPVGSIIGTVGRRFATELDSSVVSVDSSMTGAKNGHVRHKRQMATGDIPRSGIDTDAGRGFSGTGGWLSGYKLHMSCSTGTLVAPLSASVTPADAYGNQAYKDLTGDLPDTVRHVVADAGHDDQKPYDFSRYRGIRPVCPARRYRHTNGERLKLVSSYQVRERPGDVGLLFPATQL
jgi:hypothetical protein